MFVDSLAENIIVDSISEHEPADLDDEDPDMEDCGVMYEDEKEENDEMSDDQTAEVESDSDEEVDDKRNDDADAFKDSDADDSDSDGPPEDSNDVDDEPEIEVAPVDGDEISEGSQDLAFVAFAEILLLKSRKKRRKSSGKRKRTVGAFAAAEDYEDSINKSFNELKG